MASSKTPTPVETTAGVGIRVDGATHTYDPDLLTMLDLQELETFTGRTEVQIITDMSAKPGRITFRNFLFAASMMPGAQRLTLDEAFALATVARMNRAEFLGDDEIAAAGAAVPQA